MAGLLPDGGAISPGSEELAGYRRSNLAGKGIIVEALLRLKQGEPAALAEEVESYLAERRRRHPSQPSAAAFPQPPRPAGTRGGRRQGALLSARRRFRKHANFIVNNGGATAADIEELIGVVRGGSKIDLP